MYYVVSVINPANLGTLMDICKSLELPVTLTLLGRGTATASMLELLGIDTSEKRIVMSIVSQELMQTFIQEHRRRLYIDAPGQGILFAVPVKSVGGGKTLQYLGGHAASKAPEFNFEHELILVISNVGHTEEVMDAARTAGATGGTILHAKGANAERAQQFFKVSIIQEKEITMIVAPSAQKAAIMAAILKSAGPSSPAGSVVFSLPVSDAAGFPLTQFSAERAREASEADEPAK